VCWLCKKSTRNCDALTCAPCRKLIQKTFRVAEKWHLQKIKLQGLGQEMVDMLLGLNAEQEKFFRQEVYAKITGWDFL
jgi:hypothetical protein